MSPDLLKPKYAFALPPTQEVKVKNKRLIVKKNFKAITLFYSVLTGSNLLLFYLQ
jgi:hypothetical protein